jgi:ABC-2 type transport system ATP-binding protein
MSDYALVIEGATKGFATGKRRPWRALIGARPVADRPGRGTRNRKTVLAVDNVTLRIRKNEIYGLLGTNGSGKSTLIRLVSTLLLPDAGTISVFGHDVVRQEQAVKRMINRVSVEAAFFKKLSPMENLLYAARLYGLDAGKARKEIVRTLNLLGIATSRVNRPLENMSRGMQQKVAIARALLTSPMLLLLDEPTTGLDPRSKRDVQDFILALRRDHGATIMLTSHDMAETDRLCDRLAIIDKGKIILESTPQAMKEDYARRHGIAELPTLEDVFMEVTGHALSADSDEDATEDEDESDEQGSGAGARGEIERGETESEEEVVAR